MFFGYKKEFYGLPHYPEEGGGIVLITVYTSNYDKQSD